MALNEARDNKLLNYKIAEAHLAAQECSWKGGGRSCEYSTSNGNMESYSHVTLIETVEDALRSTGLKIGNQVHSLNQDGARYFGLTEVHGPDDARDYALVLGLRNSHDKTFPVGLVAGASVFVCDNLSFSGEVRLTRKHTVHLQRDLPQIVGMEVGRLMDLWSHQGQRIASGPAGLAVQFKIRSERIK